MTFPRRRILPFLTSFCFVICLGLSVPTQEQAALPEFANQPTFRSVHFAAQHEQEMENLVKRTIKVITENRPNELMLLLHPDGVFLGGGERRVPLKEIRTSFEDHGVLYCMIFNTACARTFFSNRAKEGTSDTMTDAAKATNFLSVRDHFRKVEDVRYSIAPSKHVPALIIVTFEIRLDSAEPEPSDGLTLGIVKQSGRWRIDQLFPEIT